MSQVRSHSGSCHCGAVSYTVETDLAPVISCNCSRCSRLGWVINFVPTDRFTLLSGEDKLSEYRFNKHKIAHLFCRECGIESFARGTAPDGSESIAINVRCLDGVDVDALDITKVDGRSF